MTLAYPLLFGQGRMCFMGCTTELLEFEGATATEDILNPN